MRNTIRQANSFGKPTHKQEWENRGVSPETRIGRQITPQPNGCWNWTAPIKDRPHPTLHGKTVVGYRFVYETLVGPILTGHVLHHVCENPICCNPAHLVPMLNGDHVAHHAALRRAS